DCCPIAGCPFGCTICC
uniref:Conotoxin ar3f n=1 Tax=Conus araneosus TaxID=101286 RepID=M3F_CONAO|nr:RecName: Full=Conotoxin ar3f [Conus araneosus]